ncbi:MAG: endo alpha-1,4 polygalactosaminidase [Mycobacterium kyogaense]|uniref:endo alpha-1,4 polygalactosaminidase n=1 Tax=Mycobacterium kyogaense TaxID=2212479 RepID=UPI002FF76C5E
MAVVLGVWCAALAPVAEAAPPELPTPGAGFDYQLGGAYAPPPGVTMVERDRTARPAGAGYDICYVNGFQTQPEDSQRFADQHPVLVVRSGGQPLADPGWPDEFLFDTSTAARRDALAAMVTPWIEGCRASGFDAVEIDNLDSYTRSGGALTAADNLAMATTYAQAAHRVGLAIAQKNAAELAPALRAAGYDFAVTESCVRFTECADYERQYPVVLDIEYADTKGGDELGEDEFAAACAGPGRSAVMILRDHDLVTPAEDGYVYRRCGT